MSHRGRTSEWPEGVEAVVFDMDGVVTDTASVHAAAWKRMFDEYLERRAQQADEPFVPFDPGDDYRRYIDGKPRSDGVRDFLAARRITLPEGDPGDPPAAETVHGLGNRKNGYFLDHLDKHGADAYPSTIELVRALRSQGVGTGIISASRNMTKVLDGAGVADLFEVKVDGVVADELGLPGKPDPAVFLEAAKRMGTHPSRAAVVEDALAGVEAARNGGFAVVVGVDRTGHPDDLRAAGADLVVGDLAEITLPKGESSESGA
jgi:beta-phosphoglucomutase family hydrolase